MLLQNKIMLGIHKIKINVDMPLIILFDKNFAGPTGCIKQE